MSINCGIVGLPNVGKSTIFQALTSAPAEAANYPFCTIEPNVGIVSISDARLDKIATLVPAKKVIPTSMEFVDIAGLVAGASKGEGLGNKFLSHIREVGLIAHVVRCFDDDDIIHVSGEINPLDDIETINIELALADLNSVQNKKDRNVRNLKASDISIRSEAKNLEVLLDSLIETLSEGKPARTLNFTEDEKKLLKEVNLITLKDQIYVCNIDENSLEEDNEYVKKVKALAASEHASVICLCGKLEADIAALDTMAERKEFLEELGLQESGLNRMSALAYHTLGLRTYFTVGEQENRAWTFREGMTAPQCASVIHTDFERGFIKAEVYHCDDLFELGSEKNIKEAGRLRMEGKEYITKDGDVLFFKFNV